MFKAYLKKDKITVDVLEWHASGKIGVDIQDSGPFMIDEGDYDLLRFSCLYDKNLVGIYERSKMKLFNDDEILECVYQRGAFGYDTKFAFIPFVQNTNILFKGAIMLDVEVIIEE